MSTLSSNQSESDVTYEVNRKWADNGLLLLPARGELCLGAVGLMNIAESSLAVRLHLGLLTGLLCEINSHSLCILQTYSLCKLHGYKSMSVSACAGI